MSTDESSTKILAVTVAIFFFTNSLYETFLPIYFHRDLEMSVPEITVILFFTFLVIGLLPLLLIRTTRHFERIISLGIISTLLFNVTLIYVQNPVILGLAYGLGFATFWPSFNLLLFRLTETKKRAFLMSLLTAAIPSITGIIAPAVGGVIIEKYGFIFLFAVSIVLYLVSFVASMKIHFKPEVEKFSVPKNGMFKIFMITFVLIGLTESYWLAYPLFVLTVSLTIISMGFVVSGSAIVIATANLLINRLSDIKGARVEFTVVGAILHATWYFALTQVSNITQVVMFSALSGLAGAFNLSWFAYYGDSFGRKFHASILVMMEIGFMIGRVINLVPTYVLVTSYDYDLYFIVLGLTSLLLTPFCLLCKKKSSVVNGS